MNSLIEVFRMHEISETTRADIIVKLGVLINNQFGSNVTEPLVYELVKLLDERHKILSDAHYLSYAKK